jgi:thiol:disulfide interchange protein DsbC
MTKLKRKLKYSILTAFLLATYLCATSVHAQEDVIRKRLNEFFTPDVVITSIKKTPYADLYEVQIGTRIVYTDRRAKHLFLGRIFDIDTREDYTSKRIEEISRIAFSDLPLELAIKTVYGNGERSIAVFSDPNCKYCKLLDRMLKEVDNITVYVFPLNILSKDSRTISRNIWCSADRSESWRAWMIDGKEPAQANSDCTYSDEDTLKIASQYEISGTPVIVFENGIRIFGLPSHEEFNELLTESKKHN